MSLTIQDKILIEQRVANEAPSVVVAYLLWLFGWFVSAHRFYLRQPRSAVLQILSYFVVIGFVWILVDAFLIPGMIRERQGQLRRRYGESVLFGNPGAP